MIQEKVICYSWMEKYFFDANYFKKDFEEKINIPKYTTGQG